MSRRKRVHLDGGTYYVVQQGSQHQGVFSAPDDYAEFARILASTLARTRTVVHAYACLPSSVHLVVQIDRLPVGRFMQTLTSRYGRSIHRRTHDTGHFFRQRYRAVLIEPERYLPRLVRYVHGLAAFDGGGAAHCSSADGYVGAVRVPWLTTHTTLRLLCQRAGIDSAAGLALAAPPEDVELFSRATNLAVLGSPAFLMTLPRCARPYRARASFDDIVRTVTSRLGVDPGEALSRSRQRKLTLARAVIAWYATERGVATLSEVARKLRRDPSTLSSAISRYRASRPELFRLAMLQDVASLAPISATPGSVQGSTAALRGGNAAPC
jgi:REP-associated tyrosine transposase